MWHGRAGNTGPFGSCRRHVGTAADAAPQPSGGVCGDVGRRCCCLDPGWARLSARRRPSSAQYEPQAISTAGCGAAAPAVCCRTRAWPPDARLLGFLLFQANPKVFMPRLRGTAAAPTAGPVSLHAAPCRGCVAPIHRHTRRPACVAHLHAWAWMDASLLGVGCSLAPAHSSWLALLPSPAAPWRPTAGMRSD